MTVAEALEECRRVDRTIISARRRMNKINEALDEKRERAREALGAARMQTEYGYEIGDRVEVSGRNPGRGSISSAYCKNGTVSILVIVMLDGRKAGRLPHSAVSLGYEGSLNTMKRIEEEADGES